MRQEARQYLPLAHRAQQYRLVGAEGRHHDARVRLLGAGRDDRAVLPPVRGGGASGNAADQHRLKAVGGTSIKSQQAHAARRSGCFALARRSSRQRSLPWREVRNYQRRGVIVA